jgi:hypothetical protein
MSTERTNSGGAADDGATPRPWRTPSAHDSEFVADGTAMPVVLDSDGALIADCDIFCLHGGAAPTEAEMTANAALIVAAVNSHGPLLAACKAFLDAHPSDRVGHWPCDCWDKLRDAIALAEGGA